MNLSLNCNTTGSAERRQDLPVVGGLRRLPVGAACSGLRLGAGAGEPLRV